MAANDVRQRSQGLPYRPSGGLQKAPSIIQLKLGARSALFHQVRQQLFELNSSAAFIWDGLTSDLSPAEVVDAMLAGGVERSVASSHVASAIDAWLREGWLIPNRLFDLIAQDPDQRLTLKLANNRCCVACFGANLPDDIMSPFVHLVTHEPAQDRILVAWLEPFYYVHSAGQWRGCFDEAALAPALKAYLTDLLSRSVESGYLVHGALLALGAKRIFLTGPPGMGKSTLTASLLALGLDVLADDIVHVCAGQMIGVPFAITLKGGAWPVLMDRFPQLARLPVFDRPDGQQVIYLVPPQPTAARADIDLFVCLDRKQSEAEAHPLDAMDAMRILLDSASSPSRQISAEDVRDLASAMNRARCYTLHYAEAAEAAELIYGLAQN